MVKHHTHLLRKLREKGWSDEELEYALHILSQSQDKKTRIHKIIDKIIPWFLFTTIFIGNLLIIFTTVPLLVFMPNLVLYGILSMLGFCFGFLFEIVIRDLKHILLIHHRFVMHILLPFIAIVGGGIVLYISNSIIPHLAVFNRHPFVLAGVYIFSFILPFILAKYLYLSLHKNKVV